METFTKLKTFVNDNCMPFQKDVACSIKYNNGKIENIANFLSSVIPSCSDIDITLKEIRNGKILGRGGFGYSYLTAFNDPSRKKIIKIAICKDDKSINELKEEILIHTKITNANHNSFVKLYGYFIKDEKDQQYKYYDYKKQFKEHTCYISEPSSYCEIYFILEAGKIDLLDLLNTLIHGKTNDVFALEPKPYTAEQLIELLSFYKISSYFIETENKIFIHNDIKMENIVAKDNFDLKLIDFGLSEITDKFFRQFKEFKGTQFTFDLLYGDCDINKLKEKYPEVKIFNYKSLFQKNRGNFEKIFPLSPFYDMFCMCIAIIQFVFCIEISKYLGIDTNFIVKLNNIKKELIPKHLFTARMKKLMFNILELLEFIYNLHQEYIMQILYYIFTIKIRLEIDIKTVIVPQVRGLYEPIPKYIDTGNKIVDDYLFFDKIIHYYIFNNMSIDEIEMIKEHFN